MEEITRFVREYSVVIILTIITIFGAIAHSTAALKVSRDKNMEFTFLDFLILFPLASFAWLMFALLWSTFIDNIALLWVVTGSGAFLWLAGLNKLANGVVETLIDRYKKDGK